MKLSKYLETHDLNPSEFAKQLAKSAPSIGNVTPEAVRCWAKGTRMPGTAMAALIVSATDGAVRVQDLHDACVGFRNPIQNENAA